MGRHRRGRRSQKPEDLRALSLQIHKALEGGGESVDINYVLRSKNKRGENEVVKKHIDIVSLSEEEIFAHFLDLQNKFHFYDIPPISDFEGIKRKKGPLNETYKLIVDSDELNRKKEERERELAKIQKTKASLIDVSYEPSEPPRKIRGIKALIKKTREKRRELESDIDFLEEPFREVRERAEGFFSVRERSEKPFRGRRGKIQEVSDEIKELSQIIKKLRKDDLVGNSREIKRNERKRAASRAKLDHYKSLNEEAEGTLARKRKFLEIIEAEEQSLLKEQADVEEKLRMKEIETIEKKIRAVEDRLSKKSDEDKKTARKVLLIEEYEKAQRDYRTIFWFCKIFADHIEGGNDDSDLLAYSNADKLFTLFHQKKGAVETIKFIEDFIRRRNLLDADNVKKKIISDLCSMINFPVNGSLITIGEWRELTGKKGVPIIERFYKADLIEQELAKGSGFSHRPPESLEEIKRADVILKYERASENPEMARIFYEYDMAENFFNDALKVDMGRKEDDLMPEIHLSAKDLGYPGYWLVKLPIDDPRAYVLGNITNCCQSIDGSGKQCVIDGVTKKNNGFYVLLKRKGREPEKDLDPIKVDGSIDYDSYDMVSEAYAWLSKDGNLVFDSLESLCPESPDTMAAEVLLEKVAKDVAEAEGSTISRVLIGRCNKKRLKFHAREREVEFIDYIKEGEMYSDSRFQSLIYESARLKKAKDELREKLPEMFGDDAEKIYISKFKSAEKTGKFLQEAEKYKEFIESLSEDEAGHIRKILFEGEFADVNIETLKKLSAVIDLEVFSVAFGNSLGKVQALLSENALKVYEQWCTFDQIKGFYVWKINSLVSDDVIKACDESGIEFDQLKDFDNEKIRVLTSENARKAYKKGMEFDQIKDFDARKIEALTSVYAIKAREEDRVTFDQIKGFDARKIEALTSVYAIKAREEDWVTFDQIKDFDARKIEALTSVYAIKAHKEGRITFDQVKDFDEVKIRALVSDEIVRACEVRWITYDKIKDFDGGKIFSLIADNVIKAYEGDHITFDKVKDLRSDEIKALTSDNAIKAYDKGWVTFDQLKDFYSDYRFEFIISDGMIKAYKEGWTTFDKIKDLNIWKIQALISDNAMKAFEQEWIVFDQVKDFDKDEIKALTSNNAIKAYDREWIEFDQIKDFDIEKIQALTSDNAIKAYEKGWIEFDQIKGFDIEKIKALTSDNVVKEYEKKWIRFSQIRDFDVEKIKALTSDNASKAYGNIWLIFNKIKSFDVWKIKSLTSVDALRAYEKRWLRFDQIKDFDLYKIEALTSNNAIRVYEKDETIFAQLKGFDVEKIKALISDDAMKAYEKDKTIFAQIKGFDIEKVKALISDNAMKAYEKDKTIFAQIKDYDVEKIQALTSDNAIKAYERDETIFAQIKDYGVAKINKLASLVIDTEVDVEDLAGNISDLIFKKLFHGGSRRTEERRKIEQDVRGILSEMEGLERLSYANLFSECVDCCATIIFAGWRQLRLPVS